MATQPDHTDAAQPTTDPAPPAVAFKRVKESLADHDAVSSIAFSNEIYIESGKGRPTHWRRIGVVLEEDATAEDVQRAENALYEAGGDDVRRRIGETTTAWYISANVGGDR